jgi:uncharacterized protein YdiU (UPF0061 family)
LFGELEALMVENPVDYTIFFRELSTIPDDIGPLKKGFYPNSACATDPEAMDKRWSAWLTKWRSRIGDARTSDEISRQMKQVNPKYSLREWFVMPAYQQAMTGNYALVRELQEVMTQPYAEQSQQIEEKYYRLKPAEFFNVGGVSHLSCSS